jgi:hypothetical protein
MAQVNSEPGVSQVPPTVVVPTKTASPAASDPQTKAAAVVVPYMQSEPGRKNDTAEGKRS